jgi:hypothetical protein
MLEQNTAFAQARKKCTTLYHPFKLHLSSAFPWTTCSSGFHITLLGIHININDIVVITWISNRTHQNRGDGFFFCFYRWRRWEAVGTLLGFLRFSCEITAAGNSLLPFVAHYIYSY